MLSVFFLAILPRCLASILAAAASMSIAGTADLPFPSPSSPPGGVPFDFLRGAALLLREDAVLPLHAVERIGHDREGQHFVEGQFFLLGWTLALFFGDIERTNRISRE